MEARAKILGHPIHQMIIVLPLGMLSGAVLFDIIHLASGGPRWAEMAYWLMLVGIISALIAAVFGLIDYLAIPRGTRAKRIGLVHGVGNVGRKGRFWIPAELVRSSIDGRHHNGVARAKRGNTFRAGFLCLAGTPEDDRPRRFPFLVLRRFRFGSLDVRYLLLLSFQPPPDGAQWHRQCLALDGWHQFN